jgi:Tol biopolymer transport system component
MSSKAPNPYIGPVPFTVSDAARFHGRDDDLRRLMVLFVAQRVVLLYSPSGAGKTSLVEAKILPALERKRFEVFPTVRVNLRLADESSSANSFVLSTINSLTPHRTKSANPALTGEERTESLLTFHESEPIGMDLVAFWENMRAVLGERRAVLFFDQFEEALTAAPHDKPRKEQFFDQLGAILEADDRLWAMFAIREDYLAELDPFRHLIPGELNSTYRLELLNEWQAMEAIQKPAATERVTFSTEAAEKLVNQLRRMTIKRRDGRTDFALGPFVEPVQLQVVCQTLWEDLEPTAHSVIQANSISPEGHVDASLKDFYSRTVSRIAAKHGVDERDIRDWFSNELTTEHGLRGQVMGTGDLSLAQTVIDALVDAHLVRVEERRGIQWYELAHDRLVAPIRHENAKWFEENLHPLQRQAELWKKDKPGRLLLRNPQLEDAQEWAREHHRRLSENDRAFLRASIREQERHDREQLMAHEVAEYKVRAERRQKRLLLGLLAFATMAIIFLTTTVYSRGQQVDEQRLEVRFQSTLAAALRQTEVAREVRAAAGPGPQLADDPDTASQLTSAAATATANAYGAALLVAEINADVRAGASAGNEAESTRQALSAAATASAAELNAMATADVADVRATAISFPMATPTAEPVRATVEATGESEEVAALPLSPLLFVSDRNGKDSVYVLYPSSGEWKELASPPGYAWWPAWCGDQVVFEWGDDIWTPEMTEIAAIPGDGSQSHAPITSSRLPEGSIMNGSPSCSLDGRFLAFSSRSEGAAGNDYKIGRVNRQAQDGMFDLLGDGFSLGGHVSWAPDHEAVVFMHFNSSERRFDIYRMVWDDNAQPVNLTQSLSASCKYPAWSPVGDRIAFTCSSSESRVWSLYVYDGLSTDPQPELILSGLHEGSERYEQRQTVRHAVTPSWSPDGKWLAFSSSKDGGDWDIYAYSLETGQLFNLTEAWSNSDEIHPWWSQ